MEQPRKESALPLRTPQAKGSSPQVEEQPGAPAKPSAEKLTAEDIINKGKKVKILARKKSYFYNKAIELNPKYAEAYNYRGIAYFDKKYYEMALSDYNNAIALNHNYFKPYNNRGNYYFVKKEYALAIKDYDMAITLSPKDARPYINRGLSISNEITWKLH